MERPDNPYASSPDPRFPHVLTTYRLTEHHTAGGMSRTLSHLAELQPELFTEISPELADSIGVANGDRVIARPLDHGLHAEARVGGQHDIGLGTRADPCRRRRQRKLFVVELENGHGGRSAVLNCGALDADAPNAPGTARAEATRRP